VSDTPDGTVVPGHESVAAATRRGRHETLAGLAPPPTTFGPRGAAMGFDPRRTLPLWVEVRRQIRRRRTQVVFGLLLLLPVVMALAFKAGAGNNNSRNSGDSVFVTTATVGGANFALFAEFASVGFLLVVVVALFCGDTVASEASWSSLRYLLAMPVSRARLLRQKFLVAAGYSAVANFLLPAWAFLVGGVFFGWAPARSPTGASFDMSTTLLRLFLIVSYVCGQLLLVAALAFLLSVITDTPLGAVGGATFMVVVSNILDTISALGDWRQILPTHFQYSWVDLLTPDITWDDMVRGTSLSVGYTAVFLVVAWSSFLRKDITS
jgi:ABC-2 type transport system permease protein